MQVATRNNVRESGNAAGRPIMFAHGYGCDQAMWRYVVPMFEPDFRVITFDHVGFGGSDFSAWSAAHYNTLQAYADDVIEIVEAMDLRDVIFVGHSVASMIGVLAAGARPDRFAHLILVGPSARYVDDRDAGYVGGFSPADIDELLETLEEQPPGLVDRHGTGRSWATRIVPNSPTSWRPASAAPTRGWPRPSRERHFCLTTVAISTA